MTAIAAIARKELALYFGSVTFYALTAVFLALAGYFFYGNVGFFVLMGGMNLARGLWQWQLFDLERLLLALVPLLTMRLFAEERKLGTLELLWTYPVRDVEIIAGKFVACLGVVTLMLAGTLLYPAILAVYHPVNPGPLVAGYLGLWLFAAAFVACGLAVSALTDSQLVAGVTTYGVLLFLWMITWNEAAVNATARSVLLPLSMFDRFQVFALGAVDTKDVVYLVLFSATFLTLTFFALEARRWRGVR